MHRRRWLLAAGVLFLLAAVLMLYGQGGAEETAPAVKVEMPRRLRPAEAERMRSRQVLPALPSPTHAQEAPPARPRDPLLAALPQGEGQTAVVLEANAVRHSPVGELLLKCLDRRGRNELERMRQELGVDPLTDVDRIALTEGNLVVTGNFANARFSELLRGEAYESTYGEKGRVYARPGGTRALPDGGVRTEPEVAMGLWDSQVLLMGASEAEVKAAMDRLEGRADASRPALQEQQTYGEIYGVLSGEDMAVLLDEQPELAQRLREAAARVELHVDTSSDVGLVARVEGPDADKVEDLGKMLGGALSLGRMKARADGDERLAQLLELARVQPGEDTFNLELALPLAFLEEQLAFCRERADSGQAPEQGE